MTTETACLRVFDWKGAFGMGDNYIKLEPAGKNDSCPVSRENFSVIIAANTLVWDDLEKV